MKKAVIELKDGRKIIIVLDEECAPISVANFVSLASKGHYNDTIFHRVIENFMIQGGGMLADMSEKATLKPIKGEFMSNGVNNTRKHKAGTISMARTMVKDSATAQFFICSVDTPHLDGEYAAFGEVADEESMKVVLDISRVDTGRYQYYSDVPVTPIIIEKITIIEE